MHPTTCRFGPAPCLPLLPLLSSFFCPPLQPLILCKASVGKEVRPLVLSSCPSSPEEGQTLGSSVTGMAPSPRRLPLVYPHPDTFLGAHDHLAEAGSFRRSFRMAKCDLPNSHWSLVSLYLLGSLQLRYNSVRIRIRLPSYLLGF